VTELVGEKVSLDDALVHYGVVGMKWGKTRARGTTRDIHGARQRQHYRQEEVAKAAREVNKTAAFKGNKADFTKAYRHYEKTITDLQNNPDRAIAVRMTRGEKVLAVALAGPIGLAAIAGTSGVSRRLEYKQDKRNK
jgi:hypothetical protein